MENIKNVVPSYFTIEEGALSLIAESERTFTEMMKEVGISELHSFEETGLIHEAYNVRQTINKIITWFEDQWDKIRKFIDSCLDAIDKKISEVKKKIIKSDLLQPAIGSIKNADKVFATTYEYPHLKEVSEEEGPLFKAANDFSLLLFSDYQKKTSVIKNDSYEVRIKDIPDTIKDIREFLEEEKNNVVKKLIAAGVEGGNDSDRIASIKKYIRGKEVKVNKEYMKAHYKEIYHAATDYNTSARQLKRSYNNAKRTYDRAIRFIKERKEEEYSYITAYLPYLKFGKEIYRDILLSSAACVTENVRTNIMLCLKISLAVKGEEEKKEKIGESAIHSTKFETELSTLFDF